MNCTGLEKETNLKFLTLWQSLLQNKDMEFKLYTVIQQQSIFHIDQTSLKCQFPWQQRTLSNETYDMLIVIDFKGNLTVKTISISHINRNELFRKKNVSTHQQFRITKECHLFSVELLFFQFGCHDNHKNLLVVFPICLTVLIVS